MSNLGTIARSGSKVSPPWSLPWVLQCCPAQGLRVSPLGSSNQRGQGRLPASVGVFLGASSAWALWEHSDGIPLPSWRPLRWFLFFVDEEVEISTLPVARNQPTPGSKPISQSRSLECTVVPVLFSKCSLSDCLRSVEVASFLLAPFAIGRVCGQAAFPSSVGRGGRSRGLCRPDARLVALSRLCASSW